MMRVFRCSGIQVFSVLAWMRFILMVVNWLSGIQALAGFYLQTSYTGKRSKNLLQAIRNYGYIDTFSHGNTDDCGAGARHGTAQTPEPCELSVLYSRCAGTLG